MTTPALMVQGTGSDVGKTLLVAGLARLFTRRGLRVRPFKPQNMSNNAGVAADGGEIGRAQMLQARACRTPPGKHMNPVLLKPESETGAQVVVQGEVLGGAEAWDYQRRKGQLLDRVLESFTILSRDAELVLVEGAGSPAEVNLRAGDIANMGFAEAADVPVVLVGDIERGGVIASLVGTMALLEERERQRVKGCCINKFRGDAALFDTAIGIIRARTGLDCLGVIPWLAAARALPEEDRPSFAEPAGADPPRGRDSPIRIAVPCFARMANFDDLDPLVLEPDVVLTPLRPGEALPGDTDLVVLPGTKNTRSDLAMLKANGWDIDLAAHARRGGWIIGICGGYQMLGHEVADPGGVEGPPGTEAGLGLLDVTTSFNAQKRRVVAAGREKRSGEHLGGYEIHHGGAWGKDCARPMATLNAGAAGAVSENGRVMGCYLHGLFARDGFRHHLLDAIRTRTDRGTEYEAGVERAIEAIADGLERATDPERWLAIARAR